MKYCLIINWNDINMFVFSESVNHEYSVPNDSSILNTTMEKGIYFVIIIFTGPECLRWG